ncbi:hypothetical protein CCACVL1_19829 [Corchorus capsularis]|uniref:Uncharacterized protein n=1 Tax=Corchorus capsularis TaxID=210143 RepID=A0A1R3HER2_COCAP|nr:hypothetical protein CCACVL1_19829 [Corchorus capsularis]
MERGGEKDFATTSAGSGVDSVSEA